MTEGDSDQMTMVLDADGIARLWWAPGVKITGDLAGEAVAALARVCGGERKPMLVDMQGTEP